MRCSCGGNSLVLQLMARIEGSHVLGLNGAVGTARELYFDDALWIVRYLVVATGGWLSGRKVLISPAAVTRVDGRHRTITVDLTSERVRHSPDIDTHRPVSRQHTSIYSPYIAFPDGYSMSYGPMASALSMGALTTSDRTELEVRRILEERANGKQVDSHLRSSKTVLTYRVRAEDGGYAGHVRDFLYDTRTWHIRYLVVAIRNWFCRRVVLVGTESIRELNWVDGFLTVERSTGHTNRIDE
jgi:hypothetical protein